MKKIIITLLFFAHFFLTLQAQTGKAETLIKEGVELHDAGEHKKAIEKYKEALKADPQSMRAKYEMALTYLELKDFRNASQLSTDVINSNENNGLSIGAYAVKSEALAEMNQIDNAIVILHEGLKKKGDVYLLHFNLALNYYKKGDLDKTLLHVRKAIDIDKTHSGAFLLNAYVSNDKGLWVQSLLSFQMFLLLEPDSRRSKNAFEEMLQIMRIKPISKEPVERSFIQQQLMRNQPEIVVRDTEVPPLTVEDGLDRGIVYKAITAAMDSLSKTPEQEDLYITFKIVNQEIMKVLSRENDSSKESILWTFYVPFFSELAASEYYEEYTRYISVSYFPESLEWWKNNPKEAEKFINWFEKGDQ